MIQMTLPMHELGPAARFQFMVERDGLDVALAWARTTMRQYRRSALSCTRGNLFYRRWIQEYQGFKAIILEQENGN